MNLFKSLMGGLTSAGAASMDAAEAKAMISEKKPLILDVREPKEFQAGHIQGARLIPLGSLMSRLEELPRDREILCVCRSGSRSEQAARQLTNAGFRAINLRGGMIGWQSAGNPVKRGK